FAEGIEKLADLTPGMVLEGVVTNVAAFGAFVDIGVHQDGLVHISAMSKSFVKDPRAVAKPGDIVRVRVLDVDPKRRRIALSMRLDDPVGAKASPTRAVDRTTPAPVARPREQPGVAKPLIANQGSADGALAEAMRRAGLGEKSGASGGASSRRRE
ncbi:MAG: binding domain protein, partial [Rhodospirillales bacterium]|nr:binding domain protein [Rhodospirillales bacterium]